MQIKEALVAAVCGIIFLAACHKDKDKNSTTTTPKTPAEYLTDAKWKMTGYKVFWSDADTTYDEDYYKNETEDCEKDNLEMYLTGGAIVDNEGALKCDASSPQIDTVANWAMIANNSKLVFSYPYATDTAIILQLDATTLKYALEFSDVTIKERDTFTFVNMK